MKPIYTGNCSHACKSCQPVQAADGWLTGPGRALQTDHQLQLCKAANLQLLIYLQRPCLGLSCTAAWACCVRPEVRTKPDISLQCQTWSSLQIFPAIWCAVAEVYRQSSGLLLLLLVTVLTGLGVQAGRLWPQAGRRRLNECDLLRRRSRCGLFLFRQLPGESTPICCISSAVVDAMSLFRQLPGCAKISCLIHSPTTSTGSIKVHTHDYRCLKSPTAVSSLYGQ